MLKQLGVEGLMGIDVVLVVVRIMKWSETLIKVQISLENYVVY